MSQRLFNGNLEVHRDCIVLRNDERTSNDVSVVDRQWNFTKMNYGVFGQRFLTVDGQPRRDVERGTGTILVPGRQMKVPKTWH